MEGRTLQGRELIERHRWTGGQPGQAQPAGQAQELGDPGDLALDQLAVLAVHPSAVEQSRGVLDVIEGVVEPLDGQPAVAAMAEVVLREEERKKRAVPFFGAAPVQR